MSRTRSRGKTASNAGAASTGRQALSGIRPTSGEQTLRELVHEYKTKGPVYRCTVQTTLKASYTNHYRKGLIDLLGVLEFRSTNTAHQPVIGALELIARTPAPGT